MVNKVVKSGICIAFGALAMLAGLVMLLGWPVYFMKHYKEIMILKPTSVSYNVWQDPKTPTYLEFFLFNLTNTAELLVNSSEHYKLKPTVMECGPYVYREDIVKTITWSERNPVRGRKRFESPVSLSKLLPGGLFPNLVEVENITWHNNSRIEFVNQRKLTFVQGLSKGKLTDLITSINPFLATLNHKHRWFSPYYYVYYENEVQKRLDRMEEIAAAKKRNRERWERVKGTLLIPWLELVPDPLPKITDAYDDFRKEIEKEHKDMYTTATVAQWLFDGIDFPLSKKLPKMKYGPHSPQNFTEDLLTVPFETFGWFYNRTEPHYEGSYLMNTGKSVFVDLGKIHKWRDSNHTTYRGRCGNVRGAELWGPYWGKPKTISIFNSDICTYMVYNRAVEKNILGFRAVEYQLPENTFDNRHKGSSEKCYCSSNSRYPTENCLPRGALNITDCRGVLDEKGHKVIPLFASQPHFRGGDRVYRSRVAGMRPQWWRMKSLFGLETFTGTTLYTKMTLQYNIMVTFMRGVQIGMNLPLNNTLMPMFWYRRHSQIAEDNLDMIRLVHRLRFGLPYAFYAIILLGLVLIIFGLLILSKGFIKFIQKLMKTKTQCCQLCRDVTRKMRR